MALKKLPFKNLNSLLAEVSIPPEYGRPKELIRRYSKVLKRGFLRPTEFQEICHWKSPRPIKHIRSNPAETVTTATRKSFATTSERKKLEYLTDLRGVSVPMASAILTIVNPQDYAIIDIRVWELLYQLGSVSTKPKGVNFGFKEWFRYLKIIRHHARKRKVQARDIERTLFETHGHFQKGTLYALLQKKN